MRNENKKFINSYLLWLILKLVNIKIYILYMHVHTHTHIQTIYTYKKNCAIWLNNICMVRELHQQTKLREWVVCEVWVSFLAHLWPFYGCFCSQKKNISWENYFPRENPKFETQQLLTFHLAGLPTYLATVHKHTCVVSVRVCEHTHACVCVFRF